MKTVEEYLSHCYSIPEIPPPLPLPAETFVASWKEAEGKEALDFLTEITGRSNMIFPLKLIMMILKYLKLLIIFQIIHH